MIPRENNHEATLGSTPAFAALVERFLSISSQEQALFLSQIQSKPCDVIYSEELCVMLGLDRLVRPDMAIDRLLRQGDLPRRKIAGRLVFSRQDVDRLIRQGSRRKTRGRPPGSRNKTSSSVVAGTG